MPPTRRRKPAEAPPPVEDDAFEDLDDGDDLEEIVDEPEEAPKPRRGRKPTKAAAAPDPVVTTEGDPYNSAWLAEHVTEVTGESHDARSVRMLLRKMANDGTLPREVGVDRTRYTFPKGENDPIVKAVIKRINAGELRTAKREQPEKVAEAPAKRTRAKATPAKATPAKRTRSRAAAAE
jgi:hypothetical protein